MIEIKTNNDTKYIQTKILVGGSSSAYTQISTQTAPNDKRNMGVRINEWKKKMLKFCNSKFVKEKKIKEKKMIKDARGRGTSIKILRGMKLLNYNDIKC